MKIPRSLLPELKQFARAGLANTTTNYAWASIYTDMIQGDASNQFLGRGFRLKRLRIFYDYSQLALSEGVRISVVIPKATFGAVVPLVNHIDPYNPNQSTVLFDRILPDAAEVLAGTFDVIGPINVEGDTTGVNVRRNDVQIYVHSASNGTNIGSTVNIAYQMWYTDA